MFSAVRSFFSRHRHKFILGGIVIGGVVLISDYAKKVTREAQEKETKELLERNHKHQHFEGTEEICNKTAMTTAQMLNSMVSGKLKSSAILNRLKSGASNKVQLWEQLMVQSFTKVVVMVYASSLVIILLRVQLNLIGGYLFRDGVDGTKRLDAATQNKYLCLYHNMIENGVQQLIKLVTQKVKGVLKNRSLKDELTVQDIEKIFWGIQSSVAEDAKDPCKTISQYCMPNRDNQEPENSLNQNYHKIPAFERVMEDTKDILDSNEIRTLSQSAVVSGFAYVMDEVCDHFRTKCNSLMKKDKEVAGTSNSDDLTDLSTFSLPMARIVPILDELVPEVYKKPCFSDSLMVKLVLMDSLKAMGANVYEAFSSNI